MKLLLGITVIMASTGWATPLSISGWGYTNIGIHIDGPDGFTFNDSGGSGAWIFYRDCVADRACDLSGGISAGPLDGGYFVSDGSTSVGFNTGDPAIPLGSVAFSIKWIATPFPLNTLREGDLEVPIAVSGTLNAWTEQGAPFFDYTFRARGTLALLANLLYDYSDSSPILSSAEFVGANVTFAGTAQPVPEPASWLLALPILAVVLFRRTRRAIPSASSTIRRTCNT